MGGVDIAREAGSGNGVEIVFFFMMYIAGFIMGHIMSDA